MSQNEDKYSLMNFLAGLGMGAIIGAAAALMMAPKTGTETREDLKSLSDEFASKAGKITKELADTSQELIKKGKELVEATSARVQEAADASKQAVESKLDDVQEAVESAETAVDEA